MELLCLVVFKICYLPNTPPTLYANIRISKVKKKACFELGQIKDEQKNSLYNPTISSVEIGVGVSEGEVV